MCFYKIELETVPRFLFCCSVSVSEYKNEFKNRKNYIEICVMESGRILCEEYGGKKHILMPHALHVMTSDTAYRTSAYKGEIQCHTTVGVDVGYRLTRYENTYDLGELKRELVKENTFLLPPDLKLGGGEYNPLLSRIKKIAVYYNSIYPSDKLRAAADWYALCAEVSDIVINELDNSKLPPGQKMYAERIRKYISEHLSERIAIPELADKMGISEGYMQNLFKNATGKSIIEFANEYKIRTAAEMATVYGMKLKDIAYQLGFNDPAYMSRLFKKIMGISFSELAKKTGARC